MRRNSSCISPRVTGSSAPNGSSISRIGGSAASARATPTRCRCPPDSSVRPSRREVGPAEPDEVEQLAHTRADARLVPAEQARHDRDVLRDGHVRKEPDLLQHVADAPAQIERIPLPSCRAPRHGSSRVRQQQPVDELEDRALAGAAAAHERDGLSAFDGEIYALQDAAASSGQAHPLERDLGCRHRHRSTVAQRACDQLSSSQLSALSGSAHGIHTRFK